MDDCNPYKNGYPSHKQLLEPIARVLLCAVYDDSNIWSKLRGMRGIVKKIWEYTLQRNKRIWSEYIEDNG